MRATLALVVLAGAGSSGAYAQGFAALVSPPRFELIAKPGERRREVLEISNAGPLPTKLRLKTADWSFDKNAVVAFDDTLQPGSCRP